MSESGEFFDIMIRKSFIFRSREIEFKFLSFNFSVVHMIDLVVLAKNQTLTQSYIVLAPSLVLREGTNNDKNSDDSDGEGDQWSYAKTPAATRKRVRIPAESGVSGIAEQVRQAVSLLSLHLDNNNTTIIPA